jgi:hypothetical protein
VVWRAIRRPSSPAMPASPLQARPPQLLAESGCNRNVPARARWPHPALISAPPVARTGRPRPRPQMMAPAAPCRTACALLVLLTSCGWSSAQSTLPTDVVSPRALGSCPAWLRAAQNLARLTPDRLLLCSAGRARRQDVRALHPGGHGPDYGQVVRGPAGPCLCCSLGARLRPVEGLTPPRARRRLVLFTGGCEQCRKAEQAWQVLAEVEDKTAIVAKVRCAGALPIRLFCRRSGAQLTEPAPRWLGPRRSTSTPTRGRATGSTSRHPLRCCSGTARCAGAVACWSSRRAGCCSDIWASPAASRAC